MSTELRLSRTIKPGTPGVAGDVFARVIADKPNDDRIAVDFKDAKGVFATAYVGNRGKSLANDILALPAPGSGAPPSVPPVEVPPSTPPVAVDKDYSADKTKIVNGQPIYPYPFLQRWSDYGVENTGTAQVALITSPMDSARKAYEFFLKTGGQRNEFGDWGSADAEITEGEKYWFTNDIWIPLSPNKASGWYKDSHHSFMQLHAAAPTENTIGGYGVRTTWAGSEGFGYIPAGGGGFERWLTETEMYDKKLHIEIYLEVARNSGVLKMFLNGQQKVSFTGNTNPAGTVVLKEGMYQSPTQGGNKVVTHGFKRSLTRLGA